MQRKQARLNGRYQRAWKCVTVDIQGSQRFQLLHDEQLSVADIVLHVLDLNPRFAEDYRKLSFSQQRKAVVVSLTGEILQRDFRLPAGSSVRVELLSNVKPRITVDNCTICLEDIDIGTTTACGHVFHNSCIAEWNIIKNSCPLCRKEMTVAYPADK